MIEVTLKRSKKLRLETKLKAAFERMQDSYVTVGIHEDAGNYETPTGRQGKSVAQVANEMEFGTDRVPSRSFMRSSTEESRSVLQRLMDRAVVNIGWNKWTVERALSRVGSQWLRVVQNKVKSNVGPPLSPKYLERKLAKGQPGRTLIATTKLLSSLAYKVVLKGEAVQEAQKAAAEEPAQTSQNTGGTSQSRSAARAEAKQQKAAAKAARKSFATDADKQARFAAQQATKARKG